jgi:polyisoprenoid-binding protein YceI
MLKKSLLSLCLLATTAIGAYAENATYKVDPTHSSVVFNIRHLVSQVEGRFRDFQGTISMDPKNLAKGSVEFTVKSDSVFTDNDKRDAHLKGEDFFAVEKYPTLSFKSSKVVARGENKFEVVGTMSLRGVSKQMMIPVTLLGVGQGFKGEVAGFRSEFTLNRKDFGMVWNSNLDKGGSVLGDEVTVRLLVEAGKN